MHGNKSIRGKHAAEYFFFMEIRIAIASARKREFDDIYERIHLSVTGSGAFGNFRIKSLLRYAVRKTFRRTKEETRRRTRATQQSLSIIPRRADHW